MTKVRNCIVWNHEDPVLGVDEGSDLVVDHSCFEGGWPGEGNIDDDPLFASPGSFRADFQTDRFEQVMLGPRKLMIPDLIERLPDYRLLPGSPAIDGGMPLGAPDRDILGVPRPCGDAPDMGAHESGDCEIPVTVFRRGDCNGDGTVDISDAVSILGALFLGDEDPACKDACDSNDDGAVDISDAVAILRVLFIGQGVIPPPGSEACGIDPDTDDLDCEMPPASCET